MRAFLFCAGKGTRLGRLTRDTPKCLLEVGPKSMLQHWLERLEEAGVKEVLVNLHYHAKQVLKAIEEYRGSMEIHSFYEPELLGSAGTLAACSEFASEGPFWAVYCDNFTDVDLHQVAKAHFEREVWATMVLFEATRPEACGVVALDPQSTVIEFVEKPAVPRSRLAWGGILVCEPHVLSLLPPRKKLDIGADLLPRLVGHAHGYVHPGFLVDMGTLEGYATAQRFHEEHKKSGR